MMHIENLAVSAQVTFGRDGAMFESLLGFVTQVSVVLWSVVLLTLIGRFVGIRIYRRGASPSAPVETVAPDAVNRAVNRASATRTDANRQAVAAQTADVAASAPRLRHAMSRPSHRVAALNVPAGKA